MASFFAMATPAEMKRRPIIEPILTDRLAFDTMQRRGGISLDTPTWSAHPLSALYPPEPVLPDVNEERMSQIDEQILATLRAFDSHALAGPHVYDKADRLYQSDAVRREPPSVGPSPLHTPSTTALDGDSLASATSTVFSFRSGSEDSHTLSPYSAGRRRSAPSVGEVSPMTLSRPGSRKEAEHWYSGTDIAANADAWVVPIHFSMPPNSLNVPGGAELSWPVLPDGNVRVRVLVSPALGHPETIARSFNMEEMRASALERPTLGGGLLDTGFDIPCPAPGTVLPVPGGLSPNFASSPMGRRFSAAPLLSPSSPRSSTSIGRVCRHELPAEPIGESPLHCTRSKRKKKKGVGMTSRG
jgi:hypothetical protein